MQLMHKLNSSGTFLPLLFSEIYKFLYLLTVTYR